MEILVVDGTAPDRKQLTDKLKALGHAAVGVPTGTAALTRLRQRRQDVLFVDTRLSDMDGLTLLQRIKGEVPSADVILLTAGGSYSEAVLAVKAGATDYMSKPLDMGTLQGELQKVAERRALQQAFAVARQSTSLSMDKVALVGQSESMLRLHERLERITTSDAPVLIRGESGTGKELVAHWIHQKSSRAGGPFVAVNCAALPDTLIEAELFGHDRGAYTGAVKARKGRFRLAHRGTLFLDEIAEIPLPTQAKLLRVLQDGEVEPLGSSEVVKVDVRLLSATHRDLRERITQGRFREDLFYRLKVLDVNVPPLRQRAGDLPILVNYFLQRFASPGRPVPDITARAWAALSNFDFPGNVRELEHAIQHAVVLAGAGDIDLMHLPTDILGSVEPEESTLAGFSPLSDAVREFQREYLRRALSLADGNRSQAAKLLGISRKSLWEKLKDQRFTT